MPYASLDDAANAALWFVGIKQDPAHEHLGVIYGDDLERTPTVTQGQKDSSRGSFSIPTGGLRALFHNHPLSENPRLNQNISRFSRDDIEQAKKLRVPSYISAGQRVRKYDPSTGKTTDVLAEFPMDEFRRYLMVKLLGRAPDDPRGLYK